MSTTDASGVERARDRTLAALEHALGHRFRDRALLDRALRHASYCHELRRRVEADREGRDPAGRAAGEADLESNERLEFLGDSVLGVVVAHALYRAKPDWPEGELSRALHAIVQGRSLAKAARVLEIGAALELGRTEESSGGRNKDSILENAFEAVVGAIFLDGGLEAASAFVERIFAEALAADAGRAKRDPKTELQETLMGETGAFPSYRLVTDSGVDGDDARFTVEVRSQGAALASGIGRTKRAAEKQAAARALSARAGEPNG